MRRTTWWQATIAGAVLVVSSVVASGADERSDKAQFRLGAQLWPHYCGNCHKARPGGERSPAEWDVIIQHMREVANLPAENARAINVYLRAH